MTTPYLRVQRAAFNAQREFKRFTADDVTAEMTEGRVDIVSPGQVNPHVTRMNTGNIRTVTAIVITPKGNSSPESAIQPSSFKAVPVEYSNLMGGKVEGTNGVASLPPLPCS